MVFCIPAGLPKWLEILLFVIFIFVLYRRFSIRGLGKSVGRAARGAPPPKPQPEARKEFTESAVTRDLRSLDLKPGAGFDEVRHAYRELAKVWHPDRFGDDAKLRGRAATKLAEINAAYERLKNHFGK